MSGELKRDLRAGKTCLGTVVTINSTVVAEILSRSGVDYLWFDLEHATLTVEQLQMLAQAAAASGVSTVARVPWNDKIAIKRALDTGVDGVIVPEVSTADEAEQAVRAATYAPRGVRGIGLGRACRWGAELTRYIGTADDDMLVIPMIETLAGLRNVRDIVRVDGVDGVLLGSLDLAMEMGLGDQVDHPRVEQAHSDVLAACEEAGAWCGIVTLIPESATARIRQGFRNVVLGIDIDVLGRFAGQVAEVGRSTAAVR